MCSHALPDIPNATSLLFLLWNGCVSQLGCHTHVLRWRRCRSCRFWWSGASGERSNRYQFCLRANRLQATPRVRMVQVHTSCRPIVPVGSSHISFSELKLNKKKCRFHITELPYIGHVLTSEGVKPDPKKVSAIKDMEVPRNSEDVRRFLGHVNYMAKFMPNLSAESEPLRRLLNLPDNEFCWGVDQRNAYETLKLMLTSDKLLQYYDSRKPVVIQTNASTAGLGAVLMQEDKPVAYASRSLT